MQTGGMKWTFQNSLTVPYLITCHLRGGADSRSLSPTCKCVHNTDVWYRCPIFSTQRHSLLCEGALQWVMSVIIKERGRQHDYTHSCAVCAWWRWLLCSSFPPLLYTTWDRAVGHQVRLRSATSSCSWQPGIYRKSDDFSFQINKTKCFQRHCSPTGRCWADEL